MLGGHVVRRWCEVSERVAPSAVLIDLDEGGAFVVRGAIEDFREVLDVDVRRAGNERGAGGQSDRQRIERRFHGAGRARLRLSAGARRRRVLPLGEAIDFVVE